jgi:hypothetical protein
MLTIVGELTALGQTGKGLNVARIRTPSGASVEVTNLSQADCIKLRGAFDKTVRLTIAATDEVVSE